MKTMKRELLILFVSATTDFMVVAGTAFSTSTVCDKKTILMCLAGGALAAARTVQQALRTNPIFQEETK